jgi:hypothetical protein
LWWAVPALIAAIVLLAEHEKQASEGFWSQQQNQ